MKEEEILNTILEKVNQISEYLEIIVLCQLSNIVLEVFNDNQKINAYDMADGNTSLREIGEKVGISKDTANNWFSKMEKIGLIRKVGSKNQYQKKFSTSNVRIVLQIFQRR